MGAAAGIVFKLRFVWLPTVLLLLFTLPRLLFGDLLPRPASRAADTRGGAAYLQAVVKRGCRSAPCRRSAARTVAAPPGGARGVSTWTVSRHGRRRRGCSGSRSGCWLDPAVTLVLLGSALAGGSSCARSGGRRVADPDPVPAHPDRFLAAIVSMRLVPVPVLVVEGRAPGRGPDGVVDDRRRRERKLRWLLRGVARRVPRDGIEARRAAQVATVSVGQATDRCSRSLSVRAVWSVDRHDDARPSHRARYRADTRPSRNGGRRRGQRAARTRGHRRGTAIGDTFGASSRHRRMGVTPYSSQAAHPPGDFMEGRG